MKDHIKHKFSKQEGDKFVQEINQRISAFFKASDSHKKANWSMVFKTLFMFSIYLAAYFTVLFGNFDNLIMLYLLWGMMGIGQAIIGMTIMHDTVHGAYSNNSWVNMLLQIPIVLIGVASEIWKIEHNYLHHNYTNVDGVDQDIDSRYVFRFSKHQKQRWFHKYQHLYATFIYSFLLVEWLTLKDFIKVIKYYKNGLIKSPREVGRIGLSILIKKAAFYIVFLVLPLRILPYDGWIVLSMFLTMIMIAGLVMTVVFQLAHVVSGPEFVAEYDHKIAKSWHMHQMSTTSNFATKNRFVAYLLGGLNFQIEHHLFPQICHVHYPEISKIIKETAEKYNVPYHHHNGFWQAVYSHYSLLRSLGNTP